MIHKVIKFESFNKLDTTISKNKFKKFDHILIQIFSGNKDETIKEIISSIKSKLPHAKIIGASAFNGILNNDITAGEIIISFSCFEKTKIDKILIEADETHMFEAGVEIAENIIHSDTKLVILFSHGDYSNELFNTSALLDGIYSINKDIIVAGGCASSTLQSYKKFDVSTLHIDTFVFDDEKSSGSAIVAASLSGEELIVNNGFNLGWKTIGKKMTVTKAESVHTFSKIYTIDHIPVLDLYKKYFGEELSNSLLSSALTLSFVVERNGIEVDATPFEISEDNAIIYTAKIKEGDIIQFGYGDPGIIIAEAINKAKFFSEQKQEAIFTYSCITRPFILGNFVKSELIPFSKLAPMCGFFTNGEFFTSKSKYMTVGKTMSFIGLSEKPVESYSSKIDIEEGIETTVHMKTSRGTYNMIQTMTEELEEDNRILNTLVEINSKILQHDDLEKFLEYVLNKIIEVIKVATHGAFFAMKDDENIELLSMSGVDKTTRDKLLNLTFKLKNSLLWEKTDGKLDKTVVLNDTSGHYKNYIDKALFNELKDNNIFLNNMITVPIQIDGKFYGTMNVDCDTKDRFSAKDIELINFFAEGIAIVIKNKILFDKTLILSKYDSLTGVTNRGYFEIVLEEHMKTVELTKEKFSIVIFDLNYLKKANDTHGHDVGDALLKDFANVINENTRKSDIFARFGGDEFALALFNIDEEFANIKLDILKQKVDDFNETHSDKPYKISYSVGMASYPEEANTYDELVKIADERMYEHKKASRVKR